jgi:cysteinyl-tRNA synthetase
VNNFTHEFIENKARRTHTYPGGRYQGGAQCSSNISSCTLSKAVSPRQAFGPNGDTGTLRELTGVLGLRLAEKTGSGDADKFIDLLVEVRGKARAQKLWALSDMIRDKLKELGVTIEDSKDGTSWRYS